MFKPKFRVAKVDDNYLLAVSGSFSLVLILIYPRLCIALISRSYFEDLLLDYHQIIDMAKNIFVSQRIWRCIGRIPRIENRS